MADDDEIPTPQTPLVEDRLPGDPDAKADLTVLPPGFVLPQEAMGPDEATRKTLASLEDRTLCGSPFVFVWKTARSSGYDVPKGLPLRMYCQQPGCLTTGYCTGAMFVPSMPQYTSMDEEDPERRPREMSPKEVVAGARFAAVRATGKPDPRSDRQIARHVGQVLGALQRSLRGEGGWRA